MQVWEKQMNHYLETGGLNPDPDLQSGWLARRRIKAQ
jgi:hypothetical protein